MGRYGVTKGDGRVRGIGDRYIMFLQTNKSFFEGGGVFQLRECSRPEFNSSQCLFDLLSSPSFLLL